MALDPDKETYIGDGVYASCDGVYIWLRAEHDNGEERVALEPEVLVKLLHYVRDELPPEWKEIVQSNLT